MYSGVYLQDLLHPVQVVKQYITSFGIRVHNMSDEISNNASKNLKAKFANVVVLIVDEKSMLGSEILCVMEAYARQTFHKGQNTLKPWGGLPVLILVGDDYQLPPIALGAFDSVCCHI